MKTFESYVNSSKPVLVDFYAEWCGPCKMMKPVLQEVKRMLGDRADILKMDIDKNPHFSQLYGIQAVPTLAIFKNGNLVWRRSGLTSAHEIAEHMKMFLE